MVQCVRSLAAGSVWAAVGFIFAVPLYVWGSEKAPEFYGSFAAAIVAAVAVVGGTYYQAELSRRREDEISRQEQIAQATDLFYWLRHAIVELGFVSEVLGLLCERLQNDGKAILDMPIEQYREVVSSEFMQELRSRAAVAARLSPALGATVASALYDTFLATDRIYRFRGARPDAKFGIEQIRKHIHIADARIAGLEQARIEMKGYLAERGVPVTLAQE